MRKIDKKINNKIRKTLTNACETALKSFYGFQWLTHLVDYSNFPNSLKVICIFDTNDSLKKLTAINGRHEFTTLIQKTLFEINVDINANQISYDTEENCKLNNNGKWADRLGK